MGLSSFKFLWWGAKDESFVEWSAYRPFKVVEGQSKSAYATSY